MIGCLTARLPMAGVALVVSLAWCLIAGADDDVSETLVVGFTAAHFADVNRTDAAAAIKVWTETMIGARGLKLSAKTVIYDEVKALTAALQNGTPDLMILLTPEYMTVQRHKLLDPMYVSVRGQAVGETYVLAVDKGRGFRSLAELRGGRLVVKMGSRMSMAESWLKNILDDAGLPEPDTLFDTAVREKNVSRTVLPVFFGKADACLVSLNGLEMMGEMNPQVRRRLTPLATSPSFVPSVTCLRSTYDSPHRAELVDALGSLDKEPKGRQILSLFRVDRLVPFDPAHLLAARELLTKDSEEPVPGVDPSSERGRASE